MIIKEISKNVARDIVRDRMPFGCFMVNGDESFIAIENSTGDAQVEHFETEAAARTFLNA